MKKRLHPYRVNEHQGSSQKNRQQAHDHPLQTPLSGQGTYTLFESQSPADTVRIALKRLCKSASKITRNGQRRDQQIHIAQMNSIGHGGERAIKWHADAMLSADRTFIFKTAIKDITARQGFLASFMGKPFNDEGGSGFHLHFSVERAGDNIMADDSGELTSTALAMIAGILEHAPALAALTNPTINAYKRLGPDTLAPYRINWGLDNRSTMVRIPPERDRGTRLEVRIGDGAANPYVISAAILAAGLDGIRRGLTPPPMLEGWTYEDESADVLPMTLEVALAALATDQVLRDMLGTTFIETFVTLKADEVRRYGESVDDPDTRDVTAWEVEEYLLHY